MYNLNALKCKYSDVCEKEIYRKNLATKALKLRWEIGVSVNVMGCQIHGKLCKVAATMSTRT